MIDAEAWSGLELLEPLSGGNRSVVWRGRMLGEAVAVRRSRRSDASLAWELDLLADLHRLGFRVPVAVASEDGRHSVDGVVVQTWLTGRAPTTADDWTLVAGELQRLHGATMHRPQRPDCCTVRDIASLRRSVDADMDALPAEVAGRIEAVFAEFGDAPTAVVHGDPSPDNIRIDEHGVVGLIDWDESRVDLTWHDLSNLGTRVLDDVDHERAERLSHAWEAVNGWTAEPEYARRRLALLDGR